MITITRVKKGLTQQELADIVNFKRQTISLIESNKYNPSLKAYIHITKILDELL
ncbi:helix-turn-helix transcriptional regulator [Bacillus cereus group sp. MYBK195-1]|uniref:helix-turn-helix transcriptional regulator n=1 Tax=Bacillus cereus group sp. MYBK195-1 TaxID=3450669 RepID=UPI003F79270D|nr:helix-turn-helix domain-containing protein [Bacillus cereus]MDA2225258.1 helix-turn-helix domain-containing protein [Bacillus cereus]